MDGKVEMFVTVLVITVVAIYLWDYLAPKVSATLPVV